MNKSSLKEHLFEKYADKIKIINFVLTEYEEVLKKLVDLNPKIIKKMINDINWRAYPIEENPTKFDYAYAYHFIKTADEVDETLKVLKMRLKI
jgi:hypothetical protein